MSVLVQGQIQDYLIGVQNFGGGGGGGGGGNREARVLPNFVFVYINFMIFQNMTFVSLPQTYYSPYVFGKTVLSKQFKPRSDATFCCV